MIKCSHVCNNEMLSLWLCLNSSLHCTHGLADSSCYRGASWWRNSAWGLSFGKNSPCQKVLLLKRWGNIYKMMSIYQRFAEASRLDSDHQGTKRFRDCVLLFGSCTACAQMSGIIHHILCLPCVPSLDLKEVWTLGLGNMDLRNL